MDLALPDTGFGEQIASGWVGTLVIGPFLTTATSIYVRPINLSTNEAPGPIVLEGNLSSC
jgi:hypothetical protein